MAMVVFCYTGLNRSFLYYESHIGDIVRVSQGSETKMRGLQGKQKIYLREGSQKKNYEI